MDQDVVTRREFVQHAAAAAAGAAVAGGIMGQPTVAAPVQATDVRKTRSYHENMEYHRLGRTDLMVSAVGIGGHVKKIPFGGGSPEFKKNRREVLAACIDHGINYADPVAQARCCSWRRPWARTEKRCTSVSTGGVPVTQTWPVTSTR